MFCPNCGLQQADATNFCLRCGADLTKKRELYGEIAAKASPAPLKAGYTEPDDTGKEFLEPVSEEEQDEEETSPQENSLIGCDDHTALPQPAPMRTPLLCLGLRRLCCVPTFLACLTYGAFCWLTHYEEILRSLQELEEPSFGWSVLASVTVLVFLGLVQSLIGMGTLYSRQALSTAFVMSAACSIIGFNLTPWAWKTRLMVFGAFSLCAVVEAAAVIGPLEKKKRSARTRGGKRNSAQPGQMRRPAQPKRAHRRTSG